MNTVQITGRLTKDPYNGEKVTSFTLAVDRVFKKDGEQSTDFPRVICFGKTAEFASKYLVKGKLVGITGHITTGSYKDDDGKTVYTTDVVAEHIEFLGGKNEKEEAGESMQEKGYAKVDDGDDIPF